MTREDLDLIRKIDGRRKSLDSERSSFIPHWQEISDYISPRTSRYMRNDRNRGEKYNLRIINETGTLASRTCQAGMMAGMSSPARPWFLLAPPDPEMSEYGPVKQWLDVVTRMMRDVFVRSNLYSVLPKVYGSMADYGTGAFGLVEDDIEVVRAYPFSIGSYMLACDHRMQVDTIYREFAMTVAQMVAKFGLANVSATVKAMYDVGKYQEWIPVIHAIEPNINAKSGSLRNSEKAFVSVYYEEGRKEEGALRISGFDEFPALAPRWYVDGEDTYGTRCPGMDALGSVKAIQLEERRKYQAIDKHVNPAMNADASLRNSGADILPGGINWVPGMASGGNPGFKPIHQIDPQAVNILSMDIKEVEYRINRCYYVDMMMMLAQGENSQMTAREVEERHQEKLLVLGPLMEQSNDDLFDPLIDRVFNIMVRQGKLPPAPEELQGQPLRVEYTSIMAQAQKLIGVTGVERFVGFVGQLSEAKQDPSVWDKVDTDQAIDEYADMTGVPSKIVVPDDVVAAKREERAQAQAAQQGAAMVPAMKDGAMAAKILSETDVAGQNALTRMLGV